MTLEILRHKLDISKFYFWFFFMLLIIGMSFNLIVVFANDYKMPVLSNKEFNNPLHFSYHYPSEVNLYQLSDIFKIGERIFSIGDFIMIFSFAYITLISISIISYYYQILRILKEKQKPIKSYRRKYGKSNKL